MTTLKQFKTIFFTIFRNNFKKTKGFGEKKSQKIASLVGISLGALVIIAYLVLFTVILTRTAIAQGIHDKLLYVFIALGQFIVLFFGAFASMSYIFFSKDNEMLSSLPVTPSAIFLAKFSMAYVAELFIGAIATVPALTAYGITCLVSGVAINAGFFIIMLLGVFIFPIIPLLFISLISIPLMYVVAFLRRRTLSNAIAIAVVILVVMSMYFAMIGSFANMSQNMDESGAVVLGPQFESLINNVSRVTIFNKPIVDAMLGVNAALNFFIYLAGIIILMAINIVMSSMFYKKGISVIIEGSAISSKRKINKELVYTSSGLKMSLIKKEFKTLANTPMMLVNSLMGVILGPVMVFFLVKTGALSGIGAEGRSQLYAIGFISYITALMVGATNQVAMVGISREGKNLYTLKALPLSADMLVKIKVYVATMLNVITVLIVSIVYIAISPRENVLAALGIILVTLTSGFGVNCLSLYNDLKDPNLKWNNITELTKNNKKSIKPILTIIGTGLFYLILGMVLSMQTAINLTWSYVLFFGSTLIFNSLLIAYGYKKLFDNPKALLESIEG